MSEFRQIKASAGSGKTYTLTSTFLSLLAGSSGASWSRPPSGCALAEEDCYGWQEILAITFTNKAAAEMRERLLQRLKTMALASRKDAKDAFWKPARAREAVDMLIRSYGSLNIRTIDSLLHLMVRLSALDFDLSPDFEPRFSDEEITGPLFDDMAERARTDEELGAIFRRACRQMLRSEKVRGFLAGERIRDRVTAMVSLMLAADGWSVRDLASPEEAEEHFQEILRGIQNDARELRARLEQEELSASKHFLNALTACIECGGRASKLPFSSAMLQKESFDDCLLKASKGRAGLALHALYESIRDDMRHLRVLMGARRLMPFAELAQAVYSRLEDEERRTGIIAASQVPRLAIRAADDSEGVNELFCRLGARVRHMLIDEFQDTSRDQWMALQPLAEEALAKNGSLTIVGDVKQAIYGWRGGDAALFDELVRKCSPLLSLAGQPTLETLPFNWRSRKRIVAWNNALFSPLGNMEVARELLRPLAEGDAELLNEQAALLCEAFDRAAQSAEKCRSGGFVKLSRLEKGREEERLSRLLPDMVEKLGCSHSLGDICILTRNNEQAAKASSWLMARHIPVVTQGSLLLAEQPVIAGIVSLLRFLNDPEDDIAFWSALLCEELLPPLPHKDAFLTGTDLLDWAARRPRRRSMAAQFSQDFPEAWEAVFAPLHDNAGLLTPYDAVMEIVERWNVMERRPEAEGFVRRFLEVLFCAEEAGISDLSGFLDLWDESGSQEKAPLPESMEAVRIMTMHKAKGLEFDVVILPWLNFSLGRASDDKALFWKSRGVGLLAPLCREMGRPWLKDRMDTARESLHLIYVAMTRAVSELYCFLPDASDGPVSLMLDTLISRQTDVLKEEGDDLYWGDKPKAPAEETPRPAAESAAPAAPAPENTVMPPEKADTETQEEQEDAWRPMGWLPRLRIFKNDLEDWTFTAKRRGTLIHHCLEGLQISGVGEASARRDAALAAARGISTFPLPVPDRENVQKEVEDCLAWYARLPETPHWLAFGTPEHSLLDGEGRQFRVDLLVDDGKELIAVEYKTGTSGDLPADGHRQQLLHYLDLLEKAMGQKARGALVYLDRREIFPIFPGDSHD
ncbi:UvrD-helicase domain-containing protein [Mailhella massiliensis]|uniref:UvrD-helicase domain-containing protein n=1 Tax=Mailhella massiliensis TaxID=1903261 RepID=UPI0023542078|nr:UvrD-helicase domain-containing protein [Mailhella massiliensis]